MKTRPCARPFVRRLSDFRATLSNFRATLPPLLAAAIVAGTATPVSGQGAAAAGARQAAAPPIDHERAAVFFREAEEVGSHSPWPGSLAGPTLFADPETRYVVANRADAEGHLARAGDVWVGTLPEGEGIANTAVEWAGVRWTMVAWPLPRGAYERRRLLAHELFHRLSPELGLPMTSPANEHLDTADGRLWLRAELRALVRALASVGDERREAIADALAFRARRQARFAAGADEERALELNEGLAEYTGIRAALPESGRAGWAALQIETREVQAAGGGLSRSFAYATGPAYGLLLDEARPGWQSDVGPDAGLAALLADAHGIRVGDALADRAEGRLDAYDGRELAAFEAEREARRAVRQAAFRGRYVDAPVLRLPVDEAFGYTFDPNGVETFEGVGQVLEVAEVRGGWGTLQVDGGVLLERGERGVTGVVVPAPSDPEARPLAGPGWSLDLADGWEVVPGNRPGDRVVRSG